FNGWRISAKHVGNPRQQQSITLLQTLLPYCSGQLFFFIELLENLLPVERPLKDPRGLLDKLAKLRDAGLGNQLLLHFGNLFVSQELLEWANNLKHRPLQLVLDPTLG